MTQKHLSSALKKSFLGTLIEDIMEHLILRCFCLYQLQLLCAVSNSAMELCFL